LPDQSLLVRGLKVRQDFFPPWRLIFLVERIHRYFVASVFAVAISIKLNPPQNRFFLVLYASTAIEISLTRL